jgi:hypothetical protein
MEIKNAEITLLIRAARVSMPAPTTSNHASDHEEDPDDDVDSPEIDDSEILADLPDDTDVRRSPSTFTIARNRWYPSAYAVSFL